MRAEAVPCTASCTWSARLRAAKCHTNNLLDNSLSQSPSCALPDALQQLGINAKQTSVDDLIQPQADRVDRGSFARMSASDGQRRDRPRAGRRDTRVHDALSIGSRNAAIDRLDLPRCRGSGTIPRSEAESGKSSQRPRQTLAPGLTSLTDAPLGELFVLTVSWVERAQTIDGSGGGGRVSGTSSPRADARVRRVGSRRAKKRDGSKRLHL